MSGVFIEVLTDFAGHRTVRVVTVGRHGRRAVTATASTATAAATTTASNTAATAVRYDSVGDVRGAGRRGGRRIDGQPVIGPEALDAGDVAEQGGTAVPGRRRLLLLGPGQVAAGRAAHDDGVSARCGRGRRRCAVVTAAGGHVHHRGATRFDDDLGAAAAAVVRRQSAAAAGVTFLVHHCGRVRVARYHAWTGAAGHGVRLLRAAPPRDGGARNDDVVAATVGRATVALVHVRYRSDGRTAALREIATTAVILAAARRPTLSTNHFAVTANPGNCSTETQKKGKT